MPLDIALRSAGASLLLLTAAVLLISQPRGTVARAFLPFALGIAGFLGVNTAFDAAELPPPIWAAASFLSRMAAVFLWLFCLVLFDGAVRSRGLVIAVATAWLAVVVLDKGYLAPPPDIDFAPLQIALGSALVLHAGWRVLRDLRGDLVEPRRRARPVFAFALLALLSTDFAADLLEGTGWRPATFLLAQNGAIALLAAALGLWLLRARDWANVPPPARRTGSPAPGPTIDPEQAIVARLAALMQAERPYLDPSLTFARFADRVGVAEPALRRAINHRLGHGHFRSFLNEYRVDEARRRLRDPAHAGDKILTIALDSGFASLASFNRVFRQATGCSPGEYRAGACGPDHDGGA